MHELRRLAYLDSLGIDAYLSRSQLPGAAPSRRLAVVKKASNAEDGQLSGAAMPSATRPSPEAGSTSGGGVAKTLHDRPPQSRPQDFSQDPSKAPSKDMAQPADLPATAAHIGRVQFSLSAIVAGRFLWLESLGDMPLAAEQVALVQAMAVALERSASSPQASVPQRPEMSRFDWPMHQNQQLDNSREAALAGLTAFMQRRIEQFQCRAVIILGSESAHWAKDAVLGVPIVQSLSTRQMLEDATSKAQVWRDLVALRVAD